MKAHLVMVISKLSFFVGKPKLHRKNTLFPVLTFVGGLSYKGATRVRYKFLEIKFESTTAKKIQY